MLQLAYQLLTEFCVRSRFEQLKLRLGLSPSISWEEARTSPQFGKQVTAAILKVLRMAGFLKYIVLYPTFQNSSSSTYREKSIFDQVLKTNLLGDDKEIFYLQEFLGLQPMDQHSPKVELDESLKARLQEISKNVKTAELRERVKLRIKANKRKIGSTREIPKPKRKDSGDPSESEDSQEGPAEDEQKMGAPEMMLEPLEQLKKFKASTEELSEKVVKSTAAVIQPTISISELLDRLNLGLAFNLVDIPSDFDKCYYTHLYKSCELCHKRQTKNALTMCLICGTLLCARSCSKNLKPDEMGNLSIHSLQYHCGSSAFLNTFTGQHIIYEQSRLYSFSSLYTNTFGLGVKECKQSNPDFKTFLLDKNAVDKVKSDLLYLKNAEIIVNQNIITNEVYLPNIF